MTCDVHLHLASCGREAADRVCHHGCLWAKLWIGGVAGALDESGMIQYMMQCIGRVVYIQQHNIVCVCVCLCVRACVCV